MLVSADLRGFPQQLGVLQTLDHHGHHLKQSQSARSPLSSAQQPMLRLQQRHGRHIHLLFVPQLLVCGGRPRGQILQEERRQLRSNVNETLYLEDLQVNLNFDLQQGQEKVPGQVALLEFSQQLHQTLQPPLLPRQLLIQLIVLIPETQQVSHTQVDKRSEDVSAACRHLQLGLQTSLTPPSLPAENRRSAATSLLRSCRPESCRRASRAADDSECVRNHNKIS